MGGTEMIIHIQDVEAYHALYQCRPFAPSERQTALIDRIALYHMQTPDEMDNRQSLPYSRALHKWVLERGYTAEEFNRAKKDYWQNEHV